jgi:hypothetical protein
MHKKMSAGLWVVLWLSWAVSMYAIGTLAYWMGEVDGAFR